MTDRRNIDPQEWELRCDLAAAYRLFARFGMDDLIFTHLSVRLPGKDHRFLLNPFGYLFDEITASSLIAVDAEGHAIEKRDDSKINNAASPSIRRCTWRATMRSASCTATPRPAWRWRRRSRACCP